MNIFHLLDLLVLFLVITILATLVLCEEEVGRRSGAGRPCARPCRRRGRGPGPSSSAWPGRHGARCRLVGRHHDLTDACGLMNRPRQAARKDTAVQFRDWRSRRYAWPGRRVHLGHHQRHRRVMEGRRVVDLTTAPVALGRRHELARPGAPALKKGDVDSFERPAVSSSTG